MTKAFIDRVLRELTVDTKTYRYNVVMDHNVRVIKRVALADLDTTAVIGGWVTVWADASI